MATSSFGSRMDVDDYVRPAPPRRHHLAVKAGRWAGGRPRGRRPPPGAHVPRHRGAPDRIVRGFRRRPAGGIAPRAPVGRAARRRAENRPRRRAWRRRRGQSPRRRRGGKHRRSQSPPDLVDRGGADPGGCGPRRLPLRLWKGGHHRHGPSHHVLSSPSPNRVGPPIQDPARPADPG